jgi:hypothetical protein
MLTTNGTHPWSFVTQIFRIGGDRKTFEVTTRNFGAVVSMLAATLYQGNHDRHDRLWNIVSTQKYILHMQMLIIT